MGRKSRTSRRDDDEYIRRSRFVLKLVAVIFVGGLILSLYEGLTAFNPPRSRTQEPLRTADIKAAGTPTTAPPASSATPTAADAPETEPQAPREPSQNDVDEIRTAFKEGDWQRAARLVRVLAFGGLDYEAFARSFEPEVLAAVKPIPAANAQKNLDGYTLLRQLRPENATYAAKERDYAAALGRTRPAATGSEAQGGISEADREFVCRAAIAEIMGQDLSSISATTRAGVVRLEYTRTSDGTRWRYACRLQNDRVVWAAVEGTRTGRWRNHPVDEEITYSLTGQGVTIVQDFGDSTITGNHPRD